MVQILEGNSFSGQLGRALREGVEKGGDFARQLGVERFKNAQQMKMEEFKKKSSIDNMNSENQILKDKYGIDLSGITSEDTRKAIISESLKGHSQKQEEELKMEKEKGEWGNIISDLRSKISYVGAPVPGKAFFANFPWSEAAKQREEYDVLAFQLERHARAAHTKGAMSTKVYQSLLSKLPDSNLSEAKNEGRINAWEKALLGYPIDDEKSIKSDKKSRAPLKSFYE